MLLVHILLRFSKCLLFIYVLCNSTIIIPHADSKAVKTNKNKKKNRRRKDQQKDSSSTNENGNHDKIGVCICSWLCIFCLSKYVAFGLIKVIFSHQK